MARARADEETRALQIEQTETGGEEQQAEAERARQALLGEESSAESVARRMAAAEAAAEEARADTADALQARAASQPAARDEAELEAAAALRAAMRALDVEVEPPFGAIAGDGSSSCPPEYPIKGNAQSMIYHEPGQVSYPPTVPEFCFASAEAAEAAGYRQSRARGQRAQN